MHSLFSYSLTLQSQSTKNANEILRQQHRQNYSQKEFGVDRNQQAEHAFAVGEQVFANFLGMGFRYGKVTRRHVDGFYDIVFAHGAKEVKVSKGRLQKAFAVGEQVFANSLEMGLHYGKVTRIHVDGFYDILFAHGEEVKVSKGKLQKVPPLKTATQDMSEGDDKNIYETGDTVSFVTVCKKTVAWGSKKDKQYGVFIYDLLGGDVHLKDASFFKTDQLVEALDFNTSDKMVAVDFCKKIYFFEKKEVAQSTEENVEETKGERECVYKWVNVYAEELTNFNGHPTCISFTSSEGNELVAIGSDSDEVHLFSLDLNNENKPKEIMLWMEDYRKPTNVLKRAGKVLDLEFLKKDNLSRLLSDDAIEIVVADASGKLTVYGLKDYGGKYRVHVNFSTDYNLNVEHGCMISCADDGSCIAVGCGDHFARVLKRLKYNNKMKNKKSLDRSIAGTKHHDSWELHAKFEVDHQILSVDISGDGKRIAVATEAEGSNVYDTALGCLINNYPSDGRVRSVCLDFDGSHLLVGGFDRKVVFYDNTSGFKPTMSLTDVATVQSVSLDAKGKRLAVGIVNGHTNVYDTDKLQLLYHHRCEKMVYVVKLSPDGKLLAIGDYNSTVTVADVEQKKVKFMHKYESDEVSKNCYIWGLDFIVVPESGEDKRMISNSDKGESKDLHHQSSRRTDKGETKGLVKTRSGKDKHHKDHHHHHDPEDFPLEQKSRYTLAVGCWNYSAFVYEFGMDAKNLENPIEIIRKDRVFDVSLSDDGKYLLVGGRDQVAALYDLSKEPPNEDPIWEVRDDERIYCVALNPKANRLAFGGTTKTVKVYEHKGKHPWRLMRKYNHAHTIHRMEFLDDEVLTAISEDGKCIIYKVTLEAPILQLTYCDAGNSLALNKEGMLAVAHGHHVTVYGKRTCGYGITDRPSLELAKELMKDPNSLKIALSSFSSLANVYDKQNTTLLYEAVDQDKEDVVQCLVEGSCPLGLLMQKKKKMNPLMLALQKQNKGIVRILLKAISQRSIVNTSTMFTSFFAAMDEESQQDEGTEGNFDESKEEANVSSVEDEGTEGNLDESKEEANVSSVEGLDNQQSGIEETSGHRGDGKKSKKGKENRASLKQLLLDSSFVTYNSTELQRSDTGGHWFPLQSEEGKESLNESNQEQLPAHSPIEPIGSTESEQSSKGRHWCWCPKKSEQGKRSLRKSNQEQHQAHSPSEPNGSTESEQSNKDNKDGITGISTFEMLGKTFPDLLLRFLSKLQLRPCEDQIIGNKKYMTLQEPLYVGIPHKSPQYFWEQFYNTCKDEGTEEAFLETKTPYLVKAYRIPIPGICGSQSLVEQESQNKGLAKSMYDCEAQIILTCSPLEIIVDAARRQQDFDVFKSGTVVDALVKYKWKVLGCWFKFKYLLFLGYLVLCTTLSLTLSNHSGTSMSDFFSVAWYAFILSIVLLICSSHYLGKEWLQFTYEYQRLMDAHQHDQRVSTPFKATILGKAVKAYICDDFWNLLDVLAFSTQLLTDVCVWTRWPGTLGFASVSVLLLFGKIFFYARGFEQWGPFVRMIQRTMQDMTSFLWVMLVFFLGFALALDVILGGNVGFTNIFGSFFTVTLLVYGEFDSILDLDDDSLLATILFELFLLVVVIILLNLLVAIMSESFSDVQENAANETLFELASIIVELEKVDKKFCEESSALLFPKWIHVLKPVNEDFKEEANHSEKRFDSIEKALKEVKNELNEDFKEEANRSDKRFDSIEKALKEVTNELRQFHKS